MEGGECHSRDADGSSVLNRLMLKYRPIAPKPFTGGTALDKLPKRTKRRYARTVPKHRGKQNGKDVMGEEQRVETLQLLPQMIEESSSSGNGSSKHGSGTSCEVVEDYSLWLSLSGGGDPTVVVGKKEVENVSDLSAMMDRMGGVESWVTMECMRGSLMTAPASCWFSFSGVISADERMRRLESDMCPRFISDSLNRVQWLNTAFTRMVMMTREQDPLPEVTLWLWMNEELLHTTNSAFTCEVKLKYTVVENRKRNKKYYSQLVPCDLWRIDGGGFAWRLDVKTALTLGGSIQSAIRSDRQ